MYPNPEAPAHHSNLVRYQDVASILLKVDNNIQHKYEVLYLSLLALCDITYIFEFGII